MKSIDSADVLDRKLNQPQLVVVVFSAPWCGPCRVLKPHLIKLHQSHPDVKLYSVNVDEVPIETIRSLPTVRAYRNGIQVGQVVGSNVASVQQLFEL